MAEGYSERGDYAEPGSESPLMGELSALHAQLDRLEHQAGKLRGKLEPVMSPRPTAETEKQPGLRAANSQANVEIARAQTRVVAVVDTITQTIDELEV